MNLYNKQIVNNSLFTVAQIIIVSLCTFFLYRYIIATLGLEKLGLWSLILSITSLGNIAQVGFTGSLVKFSAELSFEKNYKKINAVLNSSILTIGGIIMLLVLVIFFLANFFLGYFVESKWQSDGMYLLSFALVSLCINIVASLYYSVLEGLNKAFLRSISFILCTLVYVFLSVVLINYFDLKGLAYAQLIQAVFFFVFGICLSILYIPKFNLFYYKRDKKYMMSVYKYGLNFQTIGFAQMLYDPVTKFILSRYGGLNLVAIFELSSKIVKQIKSLTSGIMQNIVPKIAGLNMMADKSRILEAYRKVSKINMFLLFITLGLVVPSAKVLSIVFFGEYNHLFVLVLIITCLGWFLNGLNIPAYMINLGTGKLKGNVYGHVAIGVFNFIFCGLVGYFFEDGIFIVVAWIVSLVAGSSIIITEFHVRMKTPLTYIFDKEFFKTLMLYSIFLGLSYLINLKLDNLVILSIVLFTIVGGYYFLIFKGMKSMEKNYQYIFRNKRNEKT